MTDLSSASVQLSLSHPHPCLVCLTVSLPSNIHCVRVSPSPSPSVHVPSAASLSVRVSTSPSPPHPSSQDTNKIHLLSSCAYRRECRMNFHATHSVVVHGSFHTIGARLTKWDLLSCVVAPSEMIGYEMQRSCIELKSIDVAVRMTRELQRHAHKTSGWMMVMVAFIVRMCTFDRTTRVVGMLIKQRNMRAYVRIRLGISGKKLV